MFYRNYYLIVVIIYSYSTAGSTHTLNNYCDTSDNWTDHDMDIYMARNATTRNGLVPLWGRLICSWYINVILSIDEVFWHRAALIQATTTTTTAAAGVFNVADLASAEFMDMEMINIQNVENTLLENVNTYL